MDKPHKIFEPKGVEELLRGWLLHAHKGRDRHDEAARRLDGYHYRLGVLPTALSAVVGASVIVSLEAQLGAWLTIGVGLLGIASSALTGLQTFYGYAERAERHRAAGVKYKVIIREIEDAFATGLKPPAGKDESVWLADLKGRLDTLEQEAPVVPDSIYCQIEDKYQNVLFVPKADELGQACADQGAVQHIKA